MAAFYWSTGPGSGGAITMHLTIVGEVSNLDVRSSAATMAQQVPVTGFQQCIPTQTVDCGPVPLNFLPLTAKGFGCGVSVMTQVPVAISPSPNDPTGPGPYCDILTAGGDFTYTTQPGGTGQPGPGSPGSPFGVGATPRDACNAAQNSSVLDLARSRFDYACQLSRSDQANSTAYFAAAGVMAAIAGGFIAAAAIATFWVVQLILAVLAAIAAAVALILTALALAAAADVSRDQQWMAAAQTLWRNAVASVKRACCPDWIIISTDDLTCP
jgi:hypothetical protein